MADAGTHPGAGPSPNRAAPPPRAVSILVPTLREAANIPSLVARIDVAMGTRCMAWELLLIDDDSDDGSALAVAELAQRLPVAMHVRRGVPPGLALAVMDGIRLARFDLLVVMDADLSHPPERIPDLIDALQEGDAIVLGSRYAPGGRVDGSWGLHRAVMSRLATWLARPLAPCGDPLSGFFALHRRSVPDLATLAPVGYKIALELIVRGRLAVREVPIEFTDRRIGASKMDWREQFNYLRHLRRLYACKFETLARMLCFGLVGASGFVIDVGVYLGLERLGVDHRMARFLAFWPAVTWNWRLNRGWTFADRPRGPRARQWAAFVASSALGLVVNVGSYVALTGLAGFFAQHRLAALLAGVLLGAGVNYLIAENHVYRGHWRRGRDSNPR